MLMSKCRRQLLSYQIKLLLSSSSPGHYMYLGSDLNMCRVTGNVNLSPCDERYSGKFCPVRNFGPGNDNQSWHQQGTSSLRRLWWWDQWKILGLFAPELYSSSTTVTLTTQILERRTEVVGQIGVDELTQRSLILLASLKQLASVIESNV